MTPDEQADRTGVYIAVLTSGWVRHELAAQLVAFLDDRRYKLELNFSYDRPTPSNRNGISKRFREAEGRPDYLLMIDHDTIPYGNPLDLVEKDLDVVTFPYPIWRADGDPPLTVSLATLGEEQEQVAVGAGTEEGIREVLWGGTGMVLIARRVLEHPDLRIPFAYRYDEDGLKIWEEDSYFCWKARGAGFKIWSALSCPCGHVKELDLADVHNAVEWRRR